MYLESYLQSGFISNKTWQVIAAIPLIVAVLLTISTFFSGLVFYLGPNGTVERGPAFVVTVALFLLYAGVTAIRALHAASKPENKQRRAELFAMSLFVLPPILAGIADSFFPMIPVMAPAFFLAFLLVFTMLQEGQISTDHLTHLNNRRRADRNKSTTNLGTSKATMPCASWPIPCATLAAIAVRLSGAGVATNLLLWSPKKT